MTELEATKASLKKALIKIDTLKDKKADLVDAVYEAVADNLATVKPYKVPKPRPDKRRRKEEVAVAVLSDWQLGKKTGSYSSEICEKRVELYGDKVIDLTEIQRQSRPIRHLQVWILGDLVEGEEIFEGQAHLIDSSMYRQAIVDGPRILGNFLRKMLMNFDTVTVIATEGNHGSIGGQRRQSYHPETNSDRMLYGVTKLSLQHEKRLSFSIPEGAEESWYNIASIGEYRTLLFHGNIVGNPLTNMGSIQKRVQGWKTGGLNEKFNDVYMGHYHVPCRVTFNNTTVRVSGSTESDNNFARKNLGSSSRPSQQLMFVLPSWGVTLETSIWLADL